MTPAELKTILESLGLTLEWLARQSGVTLKTAQYWESGEKSVPDNVIKMLEKINQNFEESVQGTISMVAHISRARNQKPEWIDQVRYRNDMDLWRHRPDMAPLPAKAHAAKLSRLQRDLHKMGIVLRIVYFDPVDYDVWLKDEDEEDSEAMRSAWATLQLTKSSSDNL